MKNVVEKTCGACRGNRERTEHDGVGGKWQERCYQCRGTGKVLVFE